MRPHDAHIGALSTPRRVTLPLAFAALAACNAPATAPPAPSAPSAATASWWPWAPATPVARVEIVAPPMPLVYAAPTQLLERDFSAVAYDAAGRPLTGRKVKWSDATNWSPALALQPLSTTTVRAALPYANAAAPVTADGRCALAWKGIRATIDGVSAVAPVCGTFAIALSVEQQGALAPVTGDTVRLPAGQRCRLHASPAGGYGSYDVGWRLDGQPVGDGATLTLDTGPAGRRALVVRASDEGHDINPWRDVAIVVEVGEGAPECTSSLLVAGSSEDGDRGGGGRRGERGAGVPQRSSSSSRIAAAATASVER